MYITVRKKLEKSPKNKIIHTIIQCLNKSSNELYNQYKNKRQELNTNKMVNFKLGHKLCSACNKHWTKIKI